MTRLSEYGLHIAAGIVLLGAIVVVIAPARKHATGPRGE
jgi:hypothetical protein